MSLLEREQELAALEAVLLEGAAERAVDAFYWPRRGLD